MQDEWIDKIYEIIIDKIIEKSTYVRRKSLPTNTAPVLFNNDKLKTSEPVSTKIEEFEEFKTLFEHVSYEDYVPMITLYLKSREMVPLFMSKNTFRIKSIIDELNNKFTSPKTREGLTNLYCKFKRTYWGFKTLAKMWKIRRTPIRIQTDLYMNELDRNHKHTFQLIHKNGIYLFSLQNLARIIVDAITHQTGMFVEPLKIKNP